MSWTPRTDPAPAAWLWAKWFVLAGAALTVTALVVAPAQANRVFWYLVVPVLPAVFLVNAEVWRNLCPVATLSALRGDASVVRPLSRPAARRWTSVGIGLFLILVPLRHLLFDGSGTATAALIGGTAIAALVGGLLRDRKAGFCNSVCPILPIERLYGQRPLARVANARCVPCRACTQHACFDLNPERSGLVSLGPTATGRRWVFAPFGAFALALPGFVAGFSVASDVQGAVGVYGTVALGGLSSWLLLAALFTARSVRPARALLWAASAAVGVYYWLTPVAIVEAWALDPAWLPLLRAVPLTLVAAWTWRALLRPDESPLVPVRLER